MYLILTAGICLTAIFVLVASAVVILPLLGQCRHSHPGWPINGIQVCLDCGARRALLADDGSNRFQWTEWLKDDDFSAVTTPEPARRVVPISSLSHRTIGSVSKCARRRDA